MVPIRQLLCPADRYPVKCPYTRTPTRIVIHNTANDAPAENEIRYMQNRPEEVSFHFAVDDREIVQGLPLDRNAWASGDGHGKGNLEGIHIEICYSLSGGARFDQAEKNAAQLAAWLLDRYGWELDRVTKHQDYDGKYCPHRTLDRGWQRFLSMVAGARAPRKEEQPVTYEEWKTCQERYERELAARPISKWARPAQAYCLENGLMVGDDAGAFRPQAYLTRQEAAQLAMALLERSNPSPPGEGV